MNKKEKKVMKKRKIDHIDSNIYDNANDSFNKVTKKPSTKQTSKQSTLQNKHINRNIIMVTYIFVGLFIGLIGYLTFFISSKSTDVINNPYNKRQDLLASRIVRGEILGDNNEVLAQTIVNLDGTSNRVYPYENVFSHIVGRFDNGKTGLESSENFKLLTSNANPIEKVVKELKGEKNIGDNVVTTLNVKLQKVAYDALGNRKGAVVVMEPSTGKILTMVSKPDYDPNKIISNWNALVEDADKDSALINRATQGLYPPGSTFKMLTALEYIRENSAFEEYDYDCVGKDIFDQVEINCYNNKKHGTINLKESFAKSCNTSFSKIGMSLDLKSFHKLCNDFLFNKSLPTNIPYNQSSFVLDEKSDTSEIPQTVIGQGKTQITPFHNALIVSTIANGGTLMKPYVVDRIENYNGDLVKKYLPTTYDTIITPKEASILTDFMQSVVTDGTAKALKNSKYSVAGKTGTAEFHENKKAHAWFVGFAPVEKPQIVVSIIVEEVGTGSEFAVPIAKKIMDAYFE